MDIHMAMAIQLTDGIVPVRMDMEVIMMTVMISEYQKSKFRDNIIIIFSFSHFLFNNISMSYNFCEFIIPIY